MSTKQQFEGTVKKVIIAKGSKSEREAAVLNIGTNEYILRNIKEHSYVSHFFDHLVGKKVLIEGNLHWNTLMVSSYVEMK